MWAFMSQASDWIESFDMNIQSFPLLSHIVLKRTLDIYLLRILISRRLNYCAVLLTLESSKSAPFRAQNQLSVDESLKLGLVGRCPAPLHRRGVKALSSVLEWLDTHLWHFIHQEEQLVPHIMCHYAIFKSLHMHSTFQFQF